MTDLRTAIAITLGETAEAISAQAQPEQGTLKDLVRRRLTLLPTSDHPRMVTQLILDAMSAMHLHDSRLASVAQGLAKTERRRLLNRRASTSFGFEMWALNFTCTHSRFADGGLAELFLDADKVGTQISAIVRDAAIMTSLALQFDCPDQTARLAITREENGNPSSPLGKALDLITLPEERVS